MRLRRTSAILAQRHSCAVRQLLNEARKDGNAKGVAHLQAEKLPYAVACTIPSADFAGARSLGLSIVSGSVLNTLTQLKEAEPETEQTEDELKLGDSTNSQPAADGDVPRGLDPPTHCAQGQWQDEVLTMTLLFLRLHGLA